MSIRPEYRLLLALSFITLIGCGPAGPKPVRVSGTVLLDGQPLKEGSIRFVPKTGRPASGSINQEGRFILSSPTVGNETSSGVLPGKYTVAISTVRVIDDETAEWVAPQKYANPLTSGIEVAVGGPTDSLKIELLSEKDAPAKEAGEGADKNAGREDAAANKKLPE